MTCHTRNTWLLSLSFQIVQIGAKVMLISGLFVSSGCTILFGWVSYPSTDTSQSTFLSALFNILLNLDKYIFSSKTFPLLVLQLTRPSSRGSYVYYFVLYHKVCWCSGLQCCNDFFFCNFGKSFPQQHSNCSGEFSQPSLVYGSCLVCYV